MTTALIITFCSLILIAYLFDITSSKTKIPSVVMLLFLGWFVKQIIIFLKIQLPDFSFILPVIGTIGLILIVLEGSLELELNKSKLGLIRKSFLGALIPMIITSFLIALSFQYVGNYSFKTSLINAIPFCIISSAIAIPSVRFLNSKTKEYVIYESSFSDIIGVLFFTFISVNDSFDFSSFGSFGLQLLIMIVISFVASILLSYMLSKIQHHIKFMPIILLIILIYAISKIYHLPALLFILIFGLLIGNLDELKKIKWIEKVKPESLNSEVSKFKELVIESAFLIRSLFFLLFGYLIETSEILNQQSILWAVFIVFIIFIFRIMQLKISKLEISPLFFFAPRGLITILLYLSILPSQNIPIVNKSLIIQVILISALIMMIGLMIKKTSNGK